MKFAYDPEVEAFRDEVRDFIAKEFPEGRRAGRYGEDAVSDGEAYNTTMGFQKKLAQKDWLAMAQPPWSGPIRFSTGTWTSVKKTSQNPPSP